MPPAEKWQGVKRGGPHQFCRNYFIPSRKKQMVNAHETQTNVELVHDNLISSIFWNLPIYVVWKCEKNDQMLEIIFGVYRGSPQFIIFGTKRLSQNPGITLFSLKPQIGFKKFPFFAHFHKISIFENQNIGIVLTCY